MNFLSVQGQGAVWLLFIFLLCVILVHLLKLAKIGYRTMGKDLPPQPPAQKEDPPEPVYYLVERKKRKKKPSEYQKPKQIRFYSTDDEP